MITKEQLLLILKRKDVAVGGASALSFAAGAGVSFLVTRNRLKLKYEQLVEEEIRKAKAFYKEGTDWSDPIKLAERYHEVRSQEVAAEIVAERGYDPSNIFVEKKLEDPPGEETAEVDVTQETVEETVTLEDPEPEIINVFEQGQGGIPITQEEIEARDPDEPFIISEEEFLTNERDWIQHSLTWYEGDNVLADEQEQIVENNDIIGIANLNKFGTGTDDPNMVHVCNWSLEVLYEITKNDGDYAEIVLGLKHSDDDLFERFRPRRRLDN